MSNTEMQSKVDELRELRRMAEELDSEITAIQDAIKSHMTAHGVDELSGTDYKITWKEISSVRLDTVALKRELPDVAARYTKQSITRRFCLA